MGVSDINFQFNTIKKNYIFVNIKIYDYLII